MRLPAEWAPHERTLICWPSLSELSRGTPRDDLGMEGKDWIQEVHYRELRGLIEAASRYELVSVVVSAEDVEECATQLDGLTNIELLTHEHVNLWLRDVGPSFLLSPDSGLSAVTWSWHGYGSPDGQFGKGRHSAGRKDLYENYCIRDWARLCELDLQLGEAVAQSEGAQDIRSTSLAFEGGGVVTDGEGTGIVVWEMLDRMGKDGERLTDLQSRLQEATGLEKIIWLPNGLEESGGNAHADMVCAFVGPGQLLLAEGDERCAENREALKGQTDARGREIQVVGLPFKGPSLWDSASQAASGAVGKFYSLRNRSYTNLMFVEGAVLMPTFGDDSMDKAALEVVRGAIALAEAVGPREVVPVPWGELSRYGGGLRCISLPVPRCV